MQNPNEILDAVRDMIKDRGQTYDRATGHSGLASSVEENFTLAAKLATLRIGRPFHAYEIAVILSCVKAARVRSSPGHADSHKDMVAYDAFAAALAAEYKLYMTALEPKPLAKTEGS